MPASAPNPPIPVALCLGGVDPSGGAGLLRDALTLAALGVHPMAVSTAETLQNGLACLQIVPPALSATRRVEALRPHLVGSWGVKLGLCVLDAGELRELMARVDDLSPGPRIWDPIQAPTSGVSLHDASGLHGMAAIVLRGGNWIVAPNRHEASTFGGVPAGADPSTLAVRFLDAGARAVWLKGGHAEGGEVEDFWIDARGSRSLGIHPRLPGDRRGTGCTVAAAWLGYRLRGLDDVTAAQRAATWLRDHWSEAFAPGGAGRPVFALVQP